MPPTPRGVLSARSAAEARRRSATTAAGLSLALAVVVVLSGCTDANIQKKPIVPANSDDRLTLRGTVCTHPPDPGGFPVKVVLIVDESGSMCISDPPGSQEQPGLCEQLVTLGVVPPGVTTPARVRALQKLIAQFDAANQAGANVQISIVPFETNVKNVWPPNVSGNRFAKPDSTLTSYLANLQSQLGKGTDYQGATSYAYDLIASDIIQTQQTNPQLLPRTRYVTVFLTDGTPYPRCAGNDNLPVYADPDHPDLTWADSESAADFCNLVDPDPNADTITGFLPGTDRNQNYQIFSYVDRMMDLKQQYNIGDIRFHTVLLFNDAAVAACGPICQDIYGTYPGVSVADYPLAAKKIARWTLQQMATRGNGVFQEFYNGEIQSLGLGALDYSSLAAANVMKTLVVQSLSSAPGGDQRVVDSDGDGVPDTVDNNYTLGTSPFIVDSDGDCLDDRFESLRSDQGFKPSGDLDTRGCDPASPLTPGCKCRDTDGDGLTQFAEAFLKTQPGLVDSDGDGIPDGLEARYRLDPLAPDVAGLDTDGDGIPDVAEFKANTDPTVRDRDLYEREGYQYQVDSTVQPDGSICYDFAVTNIQLLTPPPRAGYLQGYNLFKLWFGEAPQSGVSTDYGEWKTACAWARYDPPGIRVPAGPDLTLQDGDFLTPDRMKSIADYLVNCVGTPPDEAGAPISGDAP